MARTVIMKPDHLGDLILASPAVNAIRSRSDDVHLVVGAGMTGLARFLFPEISSISEVAFPHLSKSASSPDSDADVVSAVGSASGIYNLRDDPVVADALAQAGYSVIGVQEVPSCHQTLAHQKSLEPFIGAYHPASFFSGKPVQWPDTIRHIALCISAGFPNNQWPLLYWFELAERCGSAGMRITLVGGPAETAELRFLSELLAGLEPAVVTGDADFARFIGGLAEVDVIVASDSGTAHLCSLTKPLLSLFGPSPWRQYAPFGAANKVLTRDMGCSPCGQFSMSHLNGCVTRECMAWLSPECVFRALQGLDPGPGMKIVVGASGVPS